MFATELANVKGGGTEAQAKLNEALAFVAGIEPKNEIEAALVVQMFATHVATMQAAKGYHAADMWTRRRCGRRSW